MTIQHKPFTPREFFDRHRDPTALRAEATAKAKELDPSAFAAYRPALAPNERCQICIEGESFDGDGVQHVWIGCIGSGATFGEALAMAYMWREEEQRKAAKRS